MNTLRTGFCFVLQKKIAITYRTGPVQSEVYNCETNIFNVIAENRKQSNNARQVRKEETREVCAPRTEEAGATRAASSHLRAQHNSGRLERADGDRCDNEIWTARRDLPHRLLHGAKQYRRR